MQKEKKKEKIESLKVVELKPVEGKSLELVPKVPAIRNIKQAKRLMSKLITQFIRGNVNSEEARTLAGLVKIYVEVDKDATIIDRLEEITKRINSIEAQKHE